MCEGSNEPSRSYGSSRTNVQMEDDGRGRNRSRIRKERNVLDDELSGIGTDARRHL